MKNILKQNKYISLKYIQMDLQGEKITTIIFNKILNI